MAKKMESETHNESFISHPMFSEKSFKKAFKKAIIAICNKEGKSAAETQRLLALSNCVKFSSAVPVECISNNQEATMEIYIGDTLAATELSPGHTFEQALCNMVYNISQLNMFSARDRHQLADELIIFGNAIQQFKPKEYEFYEQKLQNLDFDLSFELYAAIIEDSINCWCNASGTEFTEHLYNSKHFCEVNSLALTRFVSELFGIALRINFDNYCLL